MVADIACEDRSNAEPRSVVVNFRSDVDGTEIRRPWNDVAAATLAKVSVRASPDILGWKRIAG